MSEAKGLILHFIRCAAPAHFERWGRWMQEVHLPDLRSLDGVRAATAWPLTVQPEFGMPGVGFSHVILIETSQDVSTTAIALREREAELRKAGRIDASHCLIDVDCLEAHGRWSQKPMPSDSLKGQLLAYVMCNDPLLEQEWDLWNDEVHMPDMLSSGAFTAVSRWLRKPKNEFGTNYLTLYDVGVGGIDLAVEKSAAIMPKLARAGRKMDCHVGGLTLTLGPA